MVARFATCNHHSRRRTNSDGRANRVTAITAHLRSSSSSRRGSRRRSSRRAPAMDPTKVKAADGTKPHRSSKKDKKKKKRKPKQSIVQELTGSVLKLVESITASLDSDYKEKAPLFARAFLSHYQKYLTPGQLYEFIERSARACLDPRQLSPSAMQGSVIGSLRLLHLWVLGAAPDVLRSPDRLPRVKKLLADLGARAMERAASTWSVSALLPAVNAVKLALICEAEHACVSAFSANDCAVCENVRVNTRAGRVLEPRSTTIEGRDMPASLLPPRSHSSAPRRTSKSRRWPRRPRRRSCC